MTRNLTPSKEIEQVVARWRDKLVNLTGSNRLLNFRITKTSTVPLIYPDLPVALERLARPDARLRIVPLKEGRQHEDLPDSENSKIVDALQEFTPALGRLDVDEDVDSLGADMDPATLAGSLRNLLTRANQTFNDTGLWILYLAIGTLAYSEPHDTSTIYRSPLVLWPVTLQRPGRRMPPSLSLAQEDPLANPALALKLATMDVELPKFQDPTPLGVAQYINECSRLAEHHPGWSVTSTLSLSYFTFHKEAMYRDLIDNLDAILDSDLVVALAGVGLQEPDATLRFDPIGDERIDVEDPPEKSFQVLDADASQRAAIRAAIEGKSFVLDGPPGTGKSQTIANIVASLIPQGQSVLFVSEKAAALEVVRERLEECGLESYVLELHSHKAARKEVAAALNHAVMSRPVSRSSMAEADRRRLERTRKALSAWAAAMNLRRDPLGISLHQAIGVVSKLSDLPATRSCSGDLRALTSDQLAEIVAGGAQLSRAWRPAIQGHSFLWRGILRSAPMDEDLNLAREALADLADNIQPYERLMRELAWTQVAHCADLDALLDHWHSRTQATPDAWLLSKNFNLVREAAQQAEALLSEKRDALTAARTQAGDNWVNLAFADRSNPLKETLAALKKVTPSIIDLEDRHLSDLRAIHDNLRNLVNHTKVALEKAHELADRMGLEQPQSLQDIDAILEICSLSDVENRPERDWLRTEVDQTVMSGLRTLEQANSDYQEAKKAANRYFLDSILDLNPRSLHARFLNVHKGLRRLSSDYRSDRDALLRASIPGIKAKVGIENLALATSWQEAAEKLTEAEGRYGSAVGPRYVRDQTDWAALKSALETAQRIAGLARATGLETLMDAVAHGTPRDATRKRLAELISSELAGARLFAADPALTDHSEEVLQLPLTELLQWTTSMMSLVETAGIKLEAANSTASMMFTCGAAAKAIDASNRSAAADDAFKQTEALLSDLLLDAFDGEETDLNALSQAVTWTDQFRKLITERARAGHESGAISEQVLADLIHSTPTPSLSRLIELWTHARDNLINSFGAERHDTLANAFADWAEAEGLISELLVDAAGQEEWFSYRDAVRKLDSFGLAPVIESAALANATSEEVPDIILREVHRRWADQLLEDDKNLQRGRSSDRDALVAEFQNLDRQLVELTVADIIEHANEYRPTLSAGEVGIIQREAARKTRHMPIRELISQTRHVTRAVKPVFMMSPLSVSQYLPADLRFDVVIFDEASQVKPEDAINCIYRGSSLIIAGDDKQLPPTNFFDFEDGSDDDDALVPEGSAATDFDSVLTIAKGSGAFTSLTLKWHYRSRHENLISFSNSRFYGGELITFPSSHREGDSVGVEFFQVEGGLYDRGGSRRNMVEARFVASRVENHFDTRAGMTLGVVAFSQQQADAIESAVDELVAKRPDLEQHLDGERLHGFFIKNLESVQGDERDVMIFSLGYGPDAAGKFTMNFGPMNRDGGWRRLNVAITRARFRNEIVASFHPGQMAESGSRGIRELRTYLDYASRGIAALSLEDSASLGDAESPFEESVLSWLRAEGHHVTPQVGTSGYRIDMAIHHPHFPARFVLGVECDGVAYHSSKTARDRDRIREQVLTGLGWKLHRIWGTAWYRHREQEQERLREAIRNAIDAPQFGLLGASKNQTRRVDVAMESVDFEAIAEWVQAYVKSDAPRPPRGMSLSEEESIPHLRRTIETVVREEGPVHMEIIDLRIRETWGIGRIGNVIRGHIERAMKGTRFAQDEAFFFDGDFGNEMPTRCHDESTKREIRHIHRREIEDTAYRISRDARAIGREELVVTTARYLGFSRVGSDVRAAIEQAITTLIDAGWLLDEAERLQANFPNLDF